MYCRIVNLFVVKVVIGNWVVFLELQYLYLDVIVSNDDTCGPIAIQVYQAYNCLYLIASEILSRLGQACAT